MKRSPRATPDPFRQLLATCPALQGAATPSPPRISASGPAGRVLAMADKRGGVRDEWAFSLAAVVAASLSAVAREVPGLPAGVAVAALRLAHRVYYYFVLGACAGIVAQRARYRAPQPIFPRDRLYREESSRSNYYSIYKILKHTRPYLH